MCVFLKLFVREFQGFIEKRSNHRTLYHIIIRQLIISDCEGFRHNSPFSKFPSPYFLYIYGPCARRQAVKTIDDEGMITDFLRFNYIFITHYILLHFIKHKYLLYNVHSIHNIFKICRKSVGQWIFQMKHANLNWKVSTSILFFQNIHFENSYLKKSRWLI